MPQPLLSCHYCLVHWDHARQCPCLERSCEQILTFAVRSLFLSLQHFELRVLIVPTRTDWQAWLRHRMSSNHPSGDERVELTPPDADPGPEDGEQDSTTGASSSSTAPSPAKTGLLEQIQDLRKQQHELKDQKKRANKEMKNAMKRRKRLQGKAGQLTDEDLVEVLRMRQASKTHTDIPPTVTRKKARAD